MIEDLKFVRIDLKSVPAAKRKEMILDLGAHGHELMVMIPNYSDVASIEFDGSGRMSWTSWDGDCPLYERYAPQFTIWSYAFARIMIEGEPKPEIPKQSYRYCSCKMDIQGMILHTETCPNWVDLKGSSPWGILRGKST